MDSIHEYAKKIQAKIDADDEQEKTPAESQKVVKNATDAEIIHKQVETLKRNNFATDKST